jgi:prepilin-type N-terminal cleavage/methylation domain-containing protein
MRLLRRRRRSGQSGFTLIELMISLVMFSFAIAGVLSVAVAMSSGYREQKTVIGAEGASRAAMEFLSDAIRGASPGVLGGNNLTIENAHSCTRGPFLVTDNAAGPDELTIVFAYGSFVTSSKTAYTYGAGTLDVVDSSQLAQGDWVLVTNYAQGHLVKIAGINSATQVQLETSPSCTPAVVFPVGGYPTGSLVVRALRARFYIQNLDNVPTLYMDPDAEGGAQGEPLAEGIEDMQVELAIDPDSNGIVENGASADDDEWFFNHANDSDPTGTELIRAVRLTLVARGQTGLQGTPASYRPAAGNHPAATTPDNFNRRVLHSVVEIRNVGGSP